MPHAKMSSSKSHIAEDADGPYQLEKSVIPSKKDYLIQSSTANPNKYSQESSKSTSSSEKEPKNIKSSSSKETKTPFSAVSKISVIKSNKPILKSELIILYPKTSKTSISVTLSPPHSLSN